MRGRQRKPEAAGSTPLSHASPSPTARHIVGRGSGVAKTTGGSDRPVGLVGRRSAPKPYNQQRRRGLSKVPLLPVSEAASSYRRYPCLGAGGGAGDVPRGWKESETAPHDGAARAYAARDGGASAAWDGRSHQPRTGRAARHSPGHRWDPSRQRADQAESAQSCPARIGGAPPRDREGQERETLRSTASAHSPRRMQADRLTAGGHDGLDKGARRVPSVLVILDSWSPAGLGRA